MKSAKQLVQIIFLVSVVIPNVHAGPIISATDAAVNAGGDFADIDNNIANTYNQSGLYDGYQDNVTDFDSYTSTTPFHSSDYNNQEWFSANSDAIVTYDLGRSVAIDAVAIWNEESAGIPYLDLYGSNDGIDFFSLALGLLPFDNFFDVNQPLDDYRYSSEVFNFDSSYLQFVRFDISGCKKDVNPYEVCSIGEVAFRTADIPEPESLALFALGFGGLILIRKRPKSSNKLSI